MARGRTRHSGDYALFWPGYVDVLSTLLLVVTFLMSIFMLAQYFASQEASGKDTALEAADAADQRADQPARAGEGQEQIGRGRARRAAGDAVDAARGERQAVGLGAVGRRAGEGGAVRASPVSPPTSRARRTSPTRRWPRSISSTSSSCRCAGRSPPSTTRSRPPRRRTRRARRASRIWARASTRRSPARCRSCSATARTSSAACASS